MNIIPPTVQEAIEIEKDQQIRSFAFPQEQESASFYNCHADPTFLEYIQKSKFLKSFGKNSPRLYITATQITGEENTLYDALIVLVTGQKIPKVELIMNIKNSHYKEFLFMDAANRIERILGLKGFLRGL